jgi:magnesium chelatase family protein
MNKLSGPLLDRIDIHIEVQKVEFEQLSEKEKVKKVKTSGNGSESKRDSE